VGHRGLTFAARIDSSRSVIQDSARAALRDFESASEILLRIAEETSVGCFFGKWEGDGEGHATGRRVERRVMTIGSATSDPRP
jgi:hypothetical protein